MKKSLSDWEKYLNPFFFQITLLGEIPLTRNQVEEIGVEIQELIQQEKISDASKKLVELSASRS